MILSSPQIRSALQSLQKERQALLKTLQDARPLLIGTVYDVLRRCGNPSCRCAAKPTHRQTLFLSTHQGKRRCQFVRQKDVQTVRRAWERYREFRKALKQIRAINLREWKLLLAKMKKRGVTYNQLI